MLAALIAFLAALVLIVTNGGGSTKHSASSGHRPTTAHRSLRHRARTGTPAPSAARKLAYRPLGTLPAGVQDPAAALISGGRVVLIGGLNAADTSSAAVTIVDSSGKTIAGPALHGAQHDAQAATLGGAVYVFGGGDIQQYGHILRYDPAAGTVSGAGQLPQPQSDVAVAAIGSTAYIVGGYNGTSYLPTILSWKPGGPAKVVGHLPAGVRYAAVAASGNRLVIAGGSLTSGATNTVYSFDPLTGTVKLIGHLPRPLTHASAATLAGASTVYVVGGRGDAVGSPTSAVEAIDPISGSVTPAGRLPGPLSDAAVVSTGGAILLAGGRSGSATQAAIGELVAR